jgi:hypothetical protein
MGVNSFLGELTEGRLKFWTGVNWGVCRRTGDGAGVVLLEESDPGGKCSTSKVSELLDSFLRCALIKDLIYSSGRVS